jgi:Rhodanase C-terminal
MPRLFKLSTEPPFLGPGGIVRYLESFGSSGDSLFRGTNFVYDERGDDPGAASPASGMGCCVLCGAPHNDYHGRCRCSSCRMLVLVCLSCQGSSASVGRGATQSLAPHLAWIDGPFVSCDDAAGDGRTDTAQRGRSSRGLQCDLCSLRPTRSMLSSAVQQVRMPGSLHDLAGHGNRSS